MKKIITFICFCFFSIFFAQPSYLDPTFGNQGKVVETFVNQSSRPEEMLKLKNGNLLLLSYKQLKGIGGVTTSTEYYFSRYNINGQLDTSFGVNGFLSYPLISINYQAPVLDMIRLNDDKILALCFYNNITKLIRFTSVGDIDTSFGQNGEIDLFIGKFYKLVQIADNKIILIGQYFDGYNNMYQFARLSENGVLDTTFGTNGKKTVDPTTYRFDILTNVKHTTNNDILVIGMSYDQGDQTNGVISRFTSSANLDTTFGTNGTTVLTMNSPNSYSIIEDVDVLSDGTITVCGKMDFHGGAPIGLSTKPILAKLHTNGTMVQQFGINGIMYFDELFQGNDSFRNICFDNQNRILISGYAQYPYPYSRGYYYFRLLNNDGSNATDFGNNGILYFNLGTSTTDFSNYIARIMIIDYQIYGLGWTSYGNYRKTTLFKLTKGILDVEENLTEAFTVYPNPIDKIVNISNEKGMVIQSIKVIDTKGKILQAKSFLSQSEIQMDLSNISSGMYFLHISTLNGNAVYKIIKK